MSRRGTGCCGESHFYLFVISCLIGFVPRAHCKPSLVVLKFLIGSFVNLVGNSKVCGSTSRQRPLTNVPWVPSPDRTFSVTDPRGLPPQVTFLGTLRI